MDAFLQDLRFAARQLLSHRGTTLAAVLCIALGVGGNATIFSAVDALLLRPVPGVADADRLVEVGRTQAPSDFMDTFAWPNFRDLRQASGGVLEEMAGWTFRGLSVGGREGDARMVMGMQVTGSYFDVLGLQPAVGRFFGDAETPVPGSEPLVVLSHGLWQRSFAGDPGVVGRDVVVNGRPAVVVGVAPEGFRGHVVLPGIDVWVPLGWTGPGLTDPEDLAMRRGNFMMAIGKLAPGVGVEGAREALQGAYGAIVAANPEIAGQSVGVASLRTVPAAFAGPVSLFLGVLMAVVGLVLLIACVDVAGMILARGASRSREVAVRLALGAGRGRLVRQLLTESLLLFLVGGAVAVLLTVWATGLLSALEPPFPPPFSFDVDMGVSARVLGFTLGVSLATGVLFGLGPALRASRPELVSSLKDDPATAGPGRSRLRSLLVAGQMAMTVLLLVTAGLFLQALRSARDVDPGFDPAGVVLLSFDLDLHGYGPDDGLELYRRLVERVRAVPGVEAAALARNVPLGLPSRTSYGGVNVPGVEPPGEEDAWDADLNIVSPGYFEAMGIPLLAGRDLDAGDVAGAPRVAVINRAMADRFWPDGDAVGKTFTTGDGTPYEVVGVAADSRYTSLREEGTMFTYLPLAQDWQAGMTLHVRGAGGATPALATLREAIAEVDPALPVLDATPLQEYADITHLPQTVGGTITGILGLVGLVLGAVGVYGVTAFTVGRRRREIGLRMALGSDRGDVARLVVRQGMVAPLVGMAVGLLLAVLLTRVMGSFLFGVSTLDPVAFGGALAVLSGAAVLANWLPARRAAALDPMRALRTE